MDEDAGAVDAGLDPSTPGNSCDSAIEVLLPDDGGEVVISGDTTGFENHIYCAIGLSAFPPGGLGPDVIYRFTAPGRRGLSAVITGGSLSLSQSCPSSNICPYYRETTRRPVFQGLIHEIVTGPVYVVADAASQYTIRAHSQPVAAGDTCDPPITVSLDGGSAVFEGDLLNYYYSGSHDAIDCQNRLPEVPDLAIAVPVPAASRLTAQLSKDGGLGAQLTLLGTGTGCELGCFVGRPPRERLDTGELTAGTWFIAVSGTTGFAYGQPEPFRIDFAVQPLARGDACENPLTLTFEADAGSEFASTSGDTSAAIASGSSDCGAASPDLNYAFTLSQRRNLTATLTATTGAYRPALGLRSSCAATAGVCDVAAFAGAGARISATALPPGDYLLWVGAAPNGGSGAFTLDVALTP